MIFPDWNTQTPETPALPMAREWAVDWDAGALAERGGAPYTVEGGEAVRIWVRLALASDCARFRFSAHSHDYGNEFGALIGRALDAGIRESELRRTITQALAVCPYITAVEDFRFEQRGSAVTVHFTVKTVYNSFETEVSA